MVIKDENSIVVNVALKTHITFGLNNLKISILGQGALQAFKMAVQISLNVILNGSQVVIKGWKLDAPTFSPLQKFSSNDNNRDHMWSLNVIPDGKMAYIYDEFHAKYCPFYMPSAWKYVHASFTHIFPFVIFSWRPIRWVLLVILVKGEWVCQVTSLRTFVNSEGDLRFTTANFTNNQQQQQHQEQ